MLIGLPLARYRPFNFLLTPFLFLSLPFGLNLRKLSYLFKHSVVTKPNRPHLAMLQAGQLVKHEPLHVFSVNRKQRREPVSQLRIEAFVNKDVKIDCFHSSCNNDNP